MTVYSVLDDHKTLVELACATTLAPAYAPEFLHKLVPPGPVPQNLVFIVCGGFKVPIQMLGEYSTIVENHARDTWEVRFADGSKLDVPKQGA